MAGTPGTAQRPTRRRLIGPSAPWQLVLLGVGGLLLFGSFNLSILSRERLLERGTVVRLALAPVDPRAFLLGDYMDLAYALALDVRSATSATVARPDDAVAPDPSADQAANPPDDDRETDESEPAAEGFAVVALDGRRVARFVRVQQAARPVGPGEVALRYRQRAGRVYFGTRTFYFQEGRAKAFEAAKFGEFRVDSKGTMLLVRLLDRERQPIDPARSTPEIQEGGQVEEARPVPGASESGAGAAR